MRQIIFALLLAAFFNALTWSILIPLWQYPDEQAHFAQVQDLAELGYVPTTGNDTSYEITLSEEILGTSRDGFGNNKFTYHPEYKIEYSNTRQGLQEEKLTALPISARTDLVKNESTRNPPLYYWAGSLAYKAAYAGSLIDRVYAVRFISLIFFLCTVFVSFQIAKLIFGKNKLLQITITSLVAFKPMLVFASTGVLPDTLTNLLFTLIIFFSLTILLSGIKLKTVLLTSVTVVAGIFTRQQFLISIPIIFSAIFLNFTNKKKHLIYSLAVLFLILLFMLLANTRLTTVPFFANFRIPDLKIFSLDQFLKKEFIDYLKWSTSKTITETLPWYWGVYKWLSLTVHPSYYQVVNRIIILSVIGVALKFLTSAINKKFEKEDKVLLFLIIASAVYYFLFTIWNYLFIVTHNFPFGFQGRYFFPLVVAHISIILMGTFHLSKIFFRENARIITFFLVVLMMIFNWMSLYTVVSSYYETSSLQTFINQASQYKPAILKGNVLIFVPLAAIISQILFLILYFRYIMK